MPELRNDIMTDKIECLKIDELNWLSETKLNEARELLAIITSISILG